MITYTWKIDQMVCLPDNERVITVFYTVSGTDGNHISTRSNPVGISYDPAIQFTPYVNLTENDVVGWVQDNLTPDGVTAIKADIANDIAGQSAPPVAIPPLPWV